jgi:hypothetical protein
MTTWQLLLLLLPLHLPLLLAIPEGDLLFATVSAIPVKPNAGLTHPKSITSKWQLIISTPL